MSVPRMLNPLAPPRPPSMGYLGDIQVPIQHTDVQLQPPPAPEVGLKNALALSGPQMPMPDYVRAKYGKGDRNMVAALVKIANGEDGGLVGVSQEAATKFLNTWGYPIDANAWTGDQWQVALDEAAADPANTVLSRLGY